MPIYTIQEQEKASGEPLGEELTKQTRKSEDRFHIGEKIVVGTKPNQILRIIRSIPSDNPPGVNVTYVVEYMSDIDEQAGGDLVAFPLYFMRRKKTQFWS